jgi:hypothetical protein
MLLRQNQNAIQSNQAMTSDGRRENSLLYVRSFTLDAREMKARSVLARRMDGGWDHS